MKRSILDAVAGVDFDEMKSAGVREHQRERLGEKNPRTFYLLYDDTDEDEDEKVD